MFNSRWSERKNCIYAAIVVFLRAQHLAQFHFLYTSFKIEQLFWKFVPDQRNTKNKCCFSVVGSDSGVAEHTRTQTTHHTLPGTLCSQNALVFSCLSYFIGPKLEAAPSTFRIFFMEKLPVWVHLSFHIFSFKMSDTFSKMKICLTFQKTLVTNLIEIDLNMCLIVVSVMLYLYSLVKFV